MLRENTEAKNKKSIVRQRNGSAERQYHLGNIGKWKYFAILITAFLAPKLFCFYDVV